MKRTIIILLLMAPLLLYAEEPGGFGEFFRKYTAREGYTGVNITKELLIATGMVEAGAEQDILSSVNSIFVVTAEKYSGEFERDAARLREGEDIKLITNIYEGTHHLSIQYKPFPDREREGRVSEVLIVSTGGARSFAVLITGNMELAKIPKLSKIGIKGFDSLNIGE